MFYDWGQGLGISHAGIQVGIGADTSGFNAMTGHTGSVNLQDQHTRARFHQVWSGYVNNSNRATTTVYFVHVKSNAS